MRLIYKAEGIEVLSVPNASIVPKAGDFVIIGNITYVVAYLIWDTGNDRVTAVCVVPS